MKKCKRFINEYEYNSKIVEESISAWWNNKFRKAYIGMAIALMLIIILFIITKNIKWLLLCILPIIIITLIYIKKKNSIKIELERISVIYKSKTPVIKVVLDEKIIMTTSNGERTCELKAIESFIETKNLIVLMIKGEMTIALDKEGFIEGSYEELLNYLPKVIKNKKQE